MKLSFMTFSTPDLDLNAVLAAAKKYGYDAIEPRIDSKHAHGIEVSCTAKERSSIRDTVERSGVSLSCLATSCVFADPAKREAMIADAIERIHLAADIGAPVMRVFGGVFPETMQREEAITGVVESLKRISDAAAQRKVIVAIETHDAWCDPAHVASVITRVNDPYIAVNWDILHPVRMGLATVDRSFELLKPWIRHLHIHDWKDDKLAPIGSGIIDHTRVVEHLKSIGYTGALSGEWISWEPYDVHLPRESAVMRRYLGSR